MRTVSCSLGSLNKCNDDKFKDMGYGDGTIETREFAARGFDGDAIISISCTRWLHRGWHLTQPMKGRYKNRIISLVPLPHLPHNLAQDLDF